MSAPETPWKQPTLLRAAEEALVALDELLHGRNIRDSYHQRTTTEQLRKVIAIEKQEQATRELNTAIVQRSVDNYERLLAAAKAALADLPADGTRTHGVNADCPDVQSGRVARCPGHPIVCESREQLRAVIAESK